MMSLNKTQLYIEQIKGEQLVDYTDKKFLTLKEYEQCVKKIVSRKFRHLSHFLLNDDEIMTNLVTSAIMADWRFDGRGCIKGYRAQCVKWAVKKTLQRLYSTQKFIYLGSEIQDSKGKIRTLLDVLVCENNFYEIKESLEHIFHSKALTQKEKDRLRQYYLEDLTYKEIGELDDMTAEGVRKSINGSLEKIKTLLYG